MGFDGGYGLVTREGTGLLTTYDSLLLAGPQSHGTRLGGRIDLSVEGERTTQGGGAEQKYIYVSESRKIPECFPLGRAKHDRFADRLHNIYFTLKRL